MDTPSRSDSMCARQDVRFETNFATEGYRRSDVEFSQPIAITICNISRSGCMVTGGHFVPGDRLLISFPDVGHLDAFAKWSQEHRAGFQFEKPIRTERFLGVLAAIGYRPRPAGHRLSDHDR